MSGKVTAKFAAVLIFALAVPCGAFAPGLAVRRPLAALPLQRAAFPARPRLQRASAAAGPTAMMLDLDAVTLADALSLVPRAAYSAYAGAAGAIDFDSNAVAVDTTIAAFLYALGKLTSVVLSKDQESTDAVELARWGVLGVFDGLCTHHWYAFLQASFENVDADVWAKGVGMTAVSSAFYTPVYCAAFLMLLTLLEAKGWDEAVKRARLDTWDLTMRTTKIWGPTNLALFTCVPLPVRTITSMGIHYLFLVGVALWDASVRSARVESAGLSAAGPEVAEPGSASDLLSLRVATAYVPLAGDLDLPGEAQAALPVSEA
jgi:hypothetical protein